MASKEVENFHHLSDAIIRVGTDVMRMKFKQRWKEQHNSEWPENPDGINYLPA
jgi:hypothetical protein